MAALRSSMKSLQSAAIWFTRRVILYSVTNPGDPSIDFYFVNNPRDKAKELLTALVERSLGHGEGVSLAADVHLDGSAFFQVGLSFDESQSNWVAQGRGWLTGGHGANEVVTNVDLSAGARCTTLGGGQSGDDLLRTFFEALAKNFTADEVSGFSS